jgi:hypothetical protein
MLYSGNPDAARPMLQQASQILQAALVDNPGDFNYLLSSCSLSGALGEAEASLTYCQAAEDALPDDAFSHALWLEDLAGGLAMGGHPDRALELIEAMFDQPFGPSYNMVRRNPEFRSLHTSTRWQRRFNDQETGP